MFKYCATIVCFFSLAGFNVSTGFSISDRDVISLRLQYEQLGDVLAEEENHEIAAAVLSELDAAYGYVLNNSRRPKNYLELHKKCVHRLKGLGTQLSLKAVILVRAFHSRIVQKSSLSNKAKIGITAGSVALVALAAAVAYAVLKKSQNTQQTGDAQPDSLQARRMSSSTWIDRRRKANPYVDQYLTYDGFMYDLSRHPKLRSNSARDGVTFLMQLVISRHPQVIDMLNQLGLSREQINEPDDKGQTALHYAVAYAPLNVVRWLIENGADADLTYNNNPTPRNMVEQCRRTDKNHLLAVLNHPRA